MIEKIIEEPKILNFPLHKDKRGSLGVIEKENIPFDIKRIYYLYDVPLGSTRGEHGHKKLEQILVCMNGACNIEINDGYNINNFELDNPNLGLYIPAGKWRRLKFIESNTIICVFASRVYEKEDYIYSYEEFIEWVK